MSDDDFVEATTIALGAESETLARMTRPMMQAEVNLMLTQALRKAETATTSAECALLVGELRAINAIQRRIDKNARKSVTSAKKAG